ncbi:hypothetical protein [Parasitella parasitica]|uniref:Uncharacterized protein n=1 Tax=Parasitella parasitica TaxID=35722 RepID=A0A0B7NFQ1_9FUNG|nr:hypothetical protein [Parasitella parasitica]
MGWNWGQANNTSDKLIEDQRVKDYRPNSAVLDSINSLHLDEDVFVLGMDSLGKWTFLNEEFDRITKMDNV